MIAAYRSPSPGGMHVDRRGAGLRFRSGCAPSSYLGCRLSRWPTSRGWGCVPHCGAALHAVHDRGMCRWNAYFGQPVAVEELLFKTDHGLIDQSLHARMGVETTNGDGFGLGWYGTNGARPGRYRSVTPAWSDVNLRDLAAHVESPLFLAHIRATTGTPVQQTNCHPFRQGQWLFVHNGVHRRLPGDAPGAAARGRSLAVRRRRGVHRLRGALLSRADLRAPGRPARRHGTRGRVRRGDRPRARRRAPDPDDGGHEQRRAAVGHPLLQPSTSRAPSSSPSTPTRCASSTRTTRACSSSPRRTASSSPSRPATSPEPGSRSLSRPR